MHTRQKLLLLKTLQGINQRKYKFRKRTKMLLLIHHEFILKNLVYCMLGERALVRNFWMTNYHQHWFDKTLEKKVYSSSSDSVPLFSYFHNFNQISKNLIASHAHFATFYCILLLIVNIIVRSLLDICFPSCRARGNLL